MPEATHDHIMSRVAAVEAKVTEYGASNAVMDERTKTMAKDITQVRQHFEDKFDGMVDTATETKMELVQHRAEFQGLQKGIERSNKQFMGWLGVGLSILGLGIAWLGNQ